jgi:hypothetical protein
MLQAASRVIDRKDLPMTAAANGKKPESATAFVADTLKSTNEQTLTAVKQTTTMTMDAASAVLESFGKLTPSLPNIPSIPFLPTKAGISQLVNVGFDATENLLSLQRGLATELVERFVPAAGAR